MGQPAFAQEYTWTTLAGPAESGAGTFDGIGAGARFAYPRSVAVDIAGTAYVADAANHTIRKITLAGSVTTLAGLAGQPGYADGVGSAARFNVPSGVAVDSAGNVYVSDEYHAIRKITPSGVVTTLAGAAGQAGSANGMGSAARFIWPRGLAVDSAGNVYVADSNNHTIRKITPDGSVTTLAGGAGLSGSEDGIGAAARFNEPSGVAVDASGNVLVADFRNHTIRKIAPGAVVTTLAGDAGQAGSSDGTNGSARFNSPWSVAVDGAGVAWVADRMNQKIRKVTPLGVVTTVAGTGEAGSFDGAANTAKFWEPYGVAVNSAGSVFVADTENQTIRMITPGGQVATLAGSAPLFGLSDGATATARFWEPFAVAIASSNVFVLDGAANTIRMITPDGMVTTLAGMGGQGGSADGTNDTARFAYPWGLTADSAGNLYVADTGNHTIRKVTPAGVVTTLAGSPGQSGAVDAARSAARFNGAQGVAADIAGNVYVADTWNHTIRMIAPAGTVTTLAGNAGQSGSADGTGSAARFTQPIGIVVDAATNIYVTDAANQTIRKISPGAVVTTLAGSPGASGSADGIGSAARFSYPVGLAIDSANNLYVGDRDNHSVRKITPAGVVTTLGGNSRQALNVDGTAALSRFHLPRGVAVDSAGKLYVADGLNRVVRMGTVACSDVPTVDVTNALVGVIRQLDTVPQTAIAWDWQIVRRPANSTANFSSPSLRNPTFVPDVPDLYALRLKATNLAGAISLRTVELRAWTPDAATLALALSLNATNLSWTTGGTTNWFSQTNVTHDGVAAAQSGSITHNQETWMETTVAGPRPLSFWWKVSSQSSDYLEFYTNGVRAARISGEVDWQVQNHSLGAGTQVLRWRYIKDSSASSGQDRGWVDQVSYTPPSGSPVLLTQPVSRTNNAGTVASFSATANGAAPLAYQWRKDGAALLDAANISGAITPTLTVSNLLKSDEGGYTLLVTNTAGSVTSSVAVLTVRDPAITSGPASQTKTIGESASFTVTAAGTAPLSYQWRKAGTPLAGAIAASLVLTNLQTADSGDYDVVVSNGFGSVTSEVARLTCLPPAEVVAWGDNFYGQTNVPPGLSNVVAVAMGGYHSLALTAEGRVVGWGNNDYGQTNVPVGLSNVIAVAAGGNHSLALTAEGRVVGWGDNYRGQTSVPTWLSNIVAVAAGGGYSLALTAAGQVVGWGSKDYGRTSVPAGLSNAVAIAAGSIDLALTAEGQVVSFGHYYYQGSVPAGLSNVVAVATGDYHRLALTAEGRVVGWDNNDYGQASVPAGLSNVIAVAAGGTHSLALTTEGRVVGWGSNWEGQTNVPVGLSNVVAVAANHDCSLALRGLPIGVAAPQIVGSRLSVGTVDRAFHYQIMARNGASSFGSTGLPPGLALDSVTGLITGRLLQAGVFTFSIYATNSVGVGAMQVKLSVNLPLPAIANSGPVVVGLGQAWQYALEVHNEPVWFGAAGLPLGLSLNPQTGVISGVPLVEGDFPVSLIASNQYGLGTGAITCRVRAILAWGNNSSGQTNVPAGLSNVVAVAAAQNHSLALTSEGRVVGWGSTTVPKGLSNVVAVAAGGSHSLALTAEGRAVGWGDDYAGLTTVAAGLSNLVAVAAGGHHSLALTVEGRVISWGGNDYGQTNVPAGLSNVVAVAAGGSHSLAATAEGRVVAWGHNDAGQTSVPPGLSNVVALAAGDMDSFALTAEGRVVGWGHYGEKMDVLLGFSNVVAIVSGNFCALAMTAEGRVVSWGDNGFGETNVPPGLSNVVAVAAGAYHSLVLMGMSPGLAAPQIVSPRLWVGTVERNLQQRVMARNGVTGFGASGLPAGLTLDAINGLITGRPLQAGTFTFTVYATNALGVGALPVTLFVNQPLPAIPSQTVVLGLGQPCHHQLVAYNEPSWFGEAGLPAGLYLDAQTGIISGVPLMEGDFPVSLVASNQYGLGRGDISLRVRTVIGWGANDHGQSDTPAGLTNVLAIAAGGGHNLALTAEGRVIGWGNNSSGQTDVPAGLSNVVAVAAGGTHSVALTSEGRVVVWGYTYRPPDGLSNVVAVAAGFSHCLALTAEGRVVSWGAQLDAPAGLSNVVAVAAGFAHSLALTAAGKVVSWGANSYGVTNVPVGLSNVVAVAVGWWHNLALTVDGRVIGWGNNDLGQTTVPARLSNVVAVAAGGSSLALTADARVVGWGTNYHQQTDSLAELGNVVVVAAGSSHNLALLLPSPNISFASRVIVPGTTVTLAVPGVVGRAAFFQWYHNGTNLLAGQSANSLVLTNLQSSQLGTYTAVSTFPFARITNAVITLRFGADLEVANLDTPLVAFAGSAQTVAWTVVNRGHQSAAVPWTDRVYLSDDAAVGNDYLVGEFTHLGVLETNQTVSRMQNIAIPSTLDPDREYWWIVVTDTGNAIAEENEGNNARVSDQPMRLLRPPAPNLRVTSVLPSANPMSGQPVTVTWSVTNAGTWTTGAGFWQDAVYYSTTPDLNGSPVLMGRAQRPRPLGTNESCSSSFTATLPQGLSGTRYFIVQTDTDNRVNEGAFENDNTTASAPVAITLTPPPDLQVANIWAPSNAVSGDSLAVSWTVTNAGPGITAETAWVDDLYLSPTNTLGTNVIYLGSFMHDGVLTNGHSYSATAAIPLPASLSGSFYLLVQTDARNQVFEHVFEANNVTASLSPIVITLAPPPDLAVSQVTAPATALASHALAVGYAVTNRGTDTLLSYLWEDHLYLTTNAAAVAAVRSGTLASVAIFASEPQSALLHFSGLDAGQSYTNTFTLTVPNGLSGSLYAIVETDSGGEVFELVRTNNLRASVAPILVESRPSDLVVTSLTAPSSAQSGSSLLLSWTVRNQGAGDTAVSSWTDRLVLSTDAVAGNADDVTLLNLDHNGLLAPGASYTVSNQVVTVPFSVAPGSYRLFLLTDSGNAVYESANEANNSSTPRSITITRTTADLNVAAVTLYPLGGEGQGEGAIPAFSEDQIAVSWRVENTGSAAPNSTTWSSAVYLSTNSVFDTNAILLAAVQNPASVAPGTAYTNALAVTLPAEIQGTFFIHVLADAATEVIEDNKANNILAATNTLQVTLRPVPDLAVHSVASPADGFSGQPFELSWTVTNRGPAAADGTWYDSVYLSLDAQFEPDLDTYIGYAERPTALTNGQSYTQTALLEIPPDVSGLFYVFVVSDSTQRVNERGSTNNNIARAAMPVSLWLHPPADLVVGTITIPTNAVAGYDMALTYVLRNQGTNAAFGPWADALYLSADDQWDIGDVLIARVSQGGFLAAGGSRTNTVSVPAPGVLPGNYHVIIRTDLVNQVPETNEFNNITATLNQTASEVRELALGAPATDQLANHQARYYRVHVTAGQWLVVELNCGAATASTELFVRYGAIPTRNEFDFIHTNPLQPNHRVLVPNTYEGDYYILAYGDFIPTPGNAIITLSARLSQFLVLDTSFGVGGNAGNFTIPINGVDFDRTCTAQLTNMAGLARPAVTHFYESNTRFYATLDLQGLAPGLYSLIVQKTNAAPVAIPNSLEVVTSLPPSIIIPAVSVPKSIGRNRAYSFSVQWGNSGLNDAPAPLLTVGNTVSFGLAPGDYSLGTRYTFLGINTHSGPPGILRPGQTEMMTFHSFSTTSAGTYTAFAERVGRNQYESFNWEPYARILKPESLSAAQFAPVFTRLIQRVGTTYGGYLQMLARNASLLPSALGDPRNPLDLLTLELTLAMADVQCSLRGRVSPHSTPAVVGGLEIIATDLDANTRTSGTVLNDGTVVIPSLAPSRYTIEVRDRLLLSPPFLDSRTNCQPSDLEFDVREGGQIVGFVYSQGMPIPNAVVELGKDGAVVESVRTDYRGRFAVSGLLDGTYMASASASGYAKAWASPVALSAGGQTVVELFLPRESTLTFQLLDDLEDPVAAASAIASLRGGLAGASFGVSSDSQGRIHLAGLPAGQYDLTVLCSNRTPLWLTNIFIGAEAAVQLPDQVMHLLGGVAGSVVGYGSAFASGDLSVQLSGSNSLVRLSLVDSNGNFSFSALSAGNYSLQVLWGTEGLLSNAPVIRVFPGQITSTFLQLPTACTIAGRILSEAFGIPVPGVSVYLQGSNGVPRASSTDEGGRYTFPVFQPGPYSVNLQTSGSNSFATIAISPNAPTAFEQDLRLAVEARLAGTLLDAGGNPVPFGQVMVFDVSNRLQVAQVAADAAGGFSFIALIPGDYWLGARASGFMFPRLRIALPQYAVVETNLIAGAATAVLGYTGSGFSSQQKVMVSISNDFTGISFFSFSNAVGNTLVTLPPGPYSLHAASESGFIGRTTFTTGASNQVAVSVSMARGLVLTGSVRFTDGNPAAGVYVQLLQSNGLSLTTQVGDTGAFGFIGLDSGVYSLGVYGENIASHRILGFVLASDLTNNIVVAPATSFLSGTVIYAGAVPPLSSVVALKDAAGLVAGVGVAGAAGNFRVPAIPQVPLQLLCEAQGAVFLATNWFAPSLGTLSVGKVQLRPVLLAAPSSGRMGLSAAEVRPLRGDTRAAKDADKLSGQVSAAIAGLERKKGLVADALHFLDDSVRNLKRFDEQLPEVPKAPRLALGLTAEAEHCIRSILGNQFTSLEKQYNDCANLRRDLEAQRNKLGKTAEDLLQAKPVREAYKKVADTALLIDDLKDCYDLLHAPMQTGIGFPIGQYVTGYIDAAAAAIAALDVLRSAFDAAYLYADSELLISPFGQLGSYRDAVRYYEQAVEDLRQSVGDSDSQLLEQIGSEVPDQLEMSIGSHSSGSVEVPLYNLCTACKTRIVAASSLDGDLVSYDACGGRISVTDTDGKSGAVQFQVLAKGLLSEASFNGLVNVRVICDVPNPPSDCDPCKQPDPPDSCGGSPRPGPYDPNDIIGPAGFGPEQWISPDQTFHYTVRFENDAVKALAPAQYVRITQLLSTNLDLRTFRLGVMGFGTNLVDVPSDRVFFQTQVNVTNDLGVVVAIVAGLDLAKGEITWEFTSLDPATGDLPWEPYVGFLPPNTNGMIGQGFVTYTIKPKAGIPTGGIINAQARIFFDYNEPMDTPNIFNTVDVNLPSSTMLPLPLTTNRNIFPVRWAGADAYGGAGISSYTIYVSDNSGPWQPWLANTPQMESLFVGQCGHSYQFYSVARDHVGNVEVATPVAQAAVLLLPNQPPVLEPITNRWLAVGQALSITNRASDPDAGQQVTFSLAPGTPAGMAVNPTNGVLTWTPACVQGSSSNVITVIATDDGCGNLISVQSFAIIVTECLQTGLGYAVGAAGGGGCFPVSLESSFGLTNLTFAVRVPAGRFTNFTVTALAPEVGSATVVSLGTTQAVVTLVPQPGQLLRGPKQFAEICFSLLPDQSSAFVWMEVQDILGLRENGTPIGNTSGQPGRTVVVSEHPLLECVQVANGKPGLLLYARPGWTCAIEERLSVQPGASWKEMTRLAVSNLVTTVPLSGTNNQAFYRAVRFAPPAPKLSLDSATGPVYRFKLTGQTNVSYAVQTTTAISPSIPWQPVLDLTLTNGWGTFDWTNGGERQRLFRAVGGF